MRGYEWFVVFSHKGLYIHAWETNVLIAAAIGNTPVAATMFSP